MDNDYIKLPEAAVKYKKSENELLRLAAEGRINLYTYRKVFIKIEIEAARQLYYNGCYPFNLSFIAYQSSNNPEGYELIKAPPGPLTPEKVSVKKQEIEALSYQIPFPEKLKIAKEIFQNKKINRNKARDILNLSGIENINIGEVLTSIYHNDGKELTIAEECYNSLYASCSNQNPDGGHKRLIENWIDKHKDILGTKAKQRILHLVNPNPKGGNPSNKK